ncbi:hypothetical protein AURDEDRAFT_111931 [Auricularia subglabra TFB-10046 SS5]|nr:hypothetical protein AURDEDRAFT_111931 [Auricularia subglabra TFB-10046 SS5]
MRFAATFATIATFVVGLASQASAMPASPDGGFIVTESALLTWLSTTDAEITYIGEPIKGLDKRVGGNVMVVYCSKRSQNVCGGPCTVYNGGATCLDAPNTNCLSASANVAFCDRSNCGGDCNQLSSCGTRLDNNFCYTPGTKSIVVPFI